MPSESNYYVLKIVPEFLKNTHSICNNRKQVRNERAMGETTKGHRRTSVVITSMLATLAVVGEEDHRSLLTRQSSRNSKLQPGSARHPVCKK